MTMALALGAPAPWRRALLPLGLLLALVLAVYRETAGAMVQIWARSDTFAHAFLVPPIVAWLIWRQRERLARLLPRTAAWAVPVFALAGLFWLLGQLSATNALAQLGFVSLLVMAVPAVLGAPATRVILFPLAFLYFAVPIGEFVIPQLMVWTADVTVMALRWSGIPVYRDGLDFVIPSGNWSVVEACSGVRYLIASFMVGTLFAYLNYRSLARRLSFVAVSILVPIVANWVRAYLIVLLGHVSGNKIAVGADHLIYGWVFFGVVITLLYLIGSRFREDAPGPAGEPPRAQDARSAAPGPRRGISGAVVAALAALAVAPALYARVLEASGAESLPTLSEVDLRPAGWERAAASRLTWKPAFRNASAQVHGTYARQGQQVGLYIAYYAEQDFERKLVSSANVLVGSGTAAWMQAARRERAVDLGGRALTLRASELRPRASVSSTEGDRLIVWQFYWVNGRLTPSDTMAKAYGALDKLLGRGDDAAVVIVHAWGEPRDTGERALDSFLKDNLDAIKAHLASARRSRTSPQEVAAETALKEAYK